MREADRVWKLVRAADGSWRCRSFDLAEDPGERRNLCDEEDPDHQKRVDMLRAYRQRLVRAYEIRHGEPAGLGDEDRIERLRSMGYIE